MLLGTNLSVPQAQSGIWAFGCASGALDLQDNTIDIWTFQSHIVACPNQGAFQEVNVTDAGGLAAKSQDWYKCYAHD
jgi:hypothetical protein